LSAASFAQIRRVRVAEIFTRAVASAAVRAPPEATALFFAALADGMGFATELTMTQRFSVCALVIGTFLSCPSADAQDPPTGCLTEQELVVAGRHYLACGQELIVRSEEDASVVLGRRVAPSAIVGLFERNGEVFVELHEVVLRPASSLDLAPSTMGPGAVAIPATAPAPPWHRRSGEIVAVETSSFLVTLGSQDGLAVGDRVAVLEEAEQQVAGQLVRTERILVVGEVFEVAPEHARVRRPCIGEPRCCLRAEEARPPSTPSSMRARGFSQEETEAPARYSLRLQSAGR